jgi:hypothetical protein
MDYLAIPSSFLFRASTCTQRGRGALRLESIVESDGALRCMPVERQSEEDLRWHSLMDKSRYVFEPKFPVVIRMAHETTALSIHIFQP